MVSVIIPTSIGGFTHIATVLPLLELEPDKEIIIGDNGSRDGTVNYLSMHECTVVCNNKNLGFAIANNKCARIAQGEYLLFLNNDTVITPGFLQEMVNVFTHDEKIAVVGCLILEANDKQVQNAGIMFTEDYIPYELGPELPGFSPGIAYQDDRVHVVREVPAITGACLMIKKEVFWEVGGFDELYVNGWEDNDLCLKVREKGYKIFYTGKTKIRHKRFGSRGRFNHERENRTRYDSIWVHTGRAKKVLKGFLNG